MPGAFWTLEEEQYLKNNFIGKSCGEIAVEIGRTKRSVQHKFNSLKLERPLPKVGDKINRLTIKEIYSKNIGSQNKTYAKVECDCDAKTIFDTLLTNIVNEHTKSCGCLKVEIQRELARKRNYKHGKSSKNNRLFRIWCGMKARCYIPSSTGYKNYGGRGVSICDEWRYDFLVFEKWAIENGYENSLTIERKNVNGNYEPDNCSWISKKQQSRNTRDSLWITAWGENKVLADWGIDDRCKIAVGMVCYRIHQGWKPETAISTPPLMTGRCFGEPKA